MMAATVAREKWSPPAIWFSRLVWAGIVANVLVAIVSIASPDFVIRLVALDPASPLVWPRFAALLLILLSLFYVAAARDPIGSRYCATITVLARFAGVVFFLIIGGNYLLFGAYDLLFGLPQALLLYSLRRREGL